MEIVFLSHEEYKYFECFAYKSKGQVTILKCMGVNVGSQEFC